MSYILDALRKADAERERGHVPGIHAQPVFAGTAPASAQRVAPPWLWAGGAALLLVAIAAVLWALLGRSPAVPAVPIVAQPVPAAVAPPAAPIIVAQAPAADLPAPRTEPAPPVRKPARPAVRPAVDAAPALPPNAKGDLKPGADADTRVYAQNELPDEIRRQLPAVTVGGSMYSPTPASRILIINGQVLHEGDAIAPGLVLQQIRLKAAVLAFKGYRYTVTF